MLSIKNITKSFGAFALKSVSFDIAEGDYFVLLGPSGAGKTALLEIIAGIRSPDAGDIYLDAKEITRERIQKRRLALVYQERALFPHMTVRRNVAYGIRSSRSDGTAVARRVEALAAEVGIEKHLDRRPGSLSGGEAQRVALARALAMNPRCLLLDEPLSSLDAGARIQLRSLLRELNHRGHTMLHVTHDYEEAVSLASKVAIIENGRIAHVGEPMEVFRHPKSKFAANFIGIRNFFKGSLQPPAADNGLPQFITDGPRFSLLTNQKPGEGYFMLRSEDVTVSLARPETSARNTFPGTIADVVPARLGMEIVVDIGVMVSALVTAESVKKLKLERGRKAWISFKATAARFLRQ